MNLVEKLLSYAMENPKKVVAVTAGLTMLFRNLNKLTKGASRFISAKQEQYNKDRYVYDHSLGIYLKTKRKLTKDDLLMIERLRSKGFTKAQAMMKLRLLED